MSNKKAINIPEPESVKTPIVDDEVKSQLPEPKGWKILIAMPTAEEKTEGGIIKASTTVKDEEVKQYLRICFKTWTRML